MKDETVCRGCGFTRHYCDCEVPDFQELQAYRPQSLEETQQREESIRADWPEYSEESIKAGAFIGLNHPYIPGDPVL